MRGAAAMKSLKALAGSSIVIACSAAQVDKADQTAKTSQFAQVNQPAQASQPEDAWHINQHTASCTPSAIISANGNVARNGTRKTWVWASDDAFSSNFSLQAGFHRPGIAP